MRKKIKKNKFNFYQQFKNYLNFDTVFQIYQQNAKSNRLLGDVLKLFRPSLFNKFKIIDLDGSSRNIGDDGQDLLTYGDIKTGQGKETCYYN